MVCTRARDSVRGYREMLEEARAEQPPELSWQAFEAKLDGRPQRPRAGKWLALTLPALAIAATFAIAWLGLSGQKRQAEVAERAPAPNLEDAHPSPAAPLRLTGSITAVAGAQHSAEALAVGSTVHEGAVLRTAADEVLHVRLSADTGIALWEESELHVVRLRQGEVVLELVRGAVSNRVAKLAAASVYRVRAGDITASVRGTRFAVSRSSEATNVTVHEGAVAVARADVELAMLHAGQSWSDAKAKMQTSAERSVIALNADSLAWPSLNLPKLPTVHTWTIQGARFSGAGRVAMRAPVGELTLHFEDNHGVSHSLTRTISAEGTTLTEEDISRVIERDREARLGTLDPQLIRPVVRSGLDGLKRCYEQSLRRSPKLAGKLTLSLRVSSTGQVVRAELATQNEELLDVGLEACITGKAATWTFPAPTGGPVSIDLPLNLKSNSP
jgi:hypothetical protein